MDPHHLSVSGDLVSGAVAVNATISGFPADRDFAFIHLNPGVSYAELYKYISTHNLDDPNTVSPVASIVFDYDAPHGTSQVMTRLPAGNYVAIDTGGQNGPTNLHSEFQVKAVQHPAALPAADATVKSIEFGFRAPATLKQGSVVRFQNDGWLVHMIIGIQARNDSDAQKIAAALRKGDDNTAQHLAINFVSFLDPASHNAVLQRTLTAPKGSWVLACFMDTQDHREHTMLGMEKIIHIK
jgi:hypothetical protein